jgi:putative heme-binding domain-containing protein
LEPKPAPTTSTRALFDGASLLGWEGDARYWRVENGAIVGESTDAQPCAETTYLVWRGGEVVDFELELEWRFPAQPARANSGVQFRSRAVAPADVQGYQADLETGADWTGGLYEQGGRAVVTRRGERVVLEAGEAKTVERFADPDALLARVLPGAWNHLRLTAFGPRLSIEVNGVLFSETIDLDPGHAARSGALALQLHAGDPMRVEYRGLELRELVPVAVAAAGTAPQWIWPTPAVSDGQVAWFRRRFALDGEPVHAELWISADNHFHAWLDGEEVATSDDWMRPLRLDLTRELVRGEHELLVRAENDKSQAGLVLQLDVDFADRERFTLRTDPTFEACLEDPAARPSSERDRWFAQAPWKSAHSFGPLGVAPWGQLAEAFDATGEAPEAGSITVPEGFQVERLYSVPLARQGSWVTLCQDDRGRFYASDQYGGLFRVSVPPLGTSGETRVEPLELALGEAQGLVWAHDALYAVVSGAGEFQSGLYRARDSDGDDVLDKVECLRAFDGDGEHGPHGVTLGPEGALYVIAGNYTKLPEPLEHCWRPRNWGEDVLLPPLYDPNGHAVEIRAPGGWVARTDRDGARWELFAAGFRNPYDLAFDERGELFTYDSDMEWDVGLPWYKPTRVFHVVSGGEYGWRSGASNWPIDSFDALPAVDELGLASPTGVVFGTGTKFPPVWQHALFAADWAYGRIFAVHLEPEGSSFRARHEVFASGQPFPVTDLVVGVDGALYVTIGGRQTQSGLYRISWKGPTDALQASDVEPNRQARELRRSLERSQGDPAATLARALALLGHADPFVRYTARLTLEQGERASWAPAVRAEREPRAALEGMLALVHAGTPEDRAFVLERALGLFETSADAAQRRDALRLIELALVRIGCDERAREELRGRLERNYPSGNERLDRSLLGLLVFLEADVAERALAELENLDSQADRIAVLYALRALGGRWEESLARHCLAALEVEIERAQGGLSVRGYLEAMRAELLAHTGLEAGEPAARSTPASSPLLDGHVRRAHSWTMAELAPRLAELARGRSFEHGEAAYETASCSRCHRMASAGANLGPDLTGAAGRYSPLDLLRAILEPSREVPDVWRDTEFWSADRLLTVGRPELEIDGELRVRATTGENVRLQSADVTERVAHPLSRMPEGLLDTLDEEEILDLLAYVLAGGDPGDARFLE